MKQQFSTLTCVFGVNCFLSSFSKSSLECQTDWIKIRPNFRPDLGPSYLQKLSADDIVGDASERVVSTIRVQTVWIQIRPDLGQTCLRND